MEFFVKRRLSVLFPVTFCSGSQRIRRQHGNDCDGSSNKEKDQGDTHAMPWPTNEIEQIFKNMSVCFYDLVVDKSWYAWFFLVKAFIQLFCPVEEKKTEFILHFTRPASCVELQESSFAWSSGTPKPAKPPQNVAWLWTQQLNRQGNPGKHIRVAKQHIGIISLRIVFMELQEHCSCSRGGNENILVYQVQLESVCILT